MARTSDARHDAACVWSPSWTTTSAQVEPSAGSASLGARLRGPVRPVPVGRRAGRSARSPPGAAQRARGRTVEIGSGTGLNLPHYPDDLDELVLIEPDAAMRSRLGEEAAPQRPAGAAGRRAGGAAAVRRRIGRHGRLDLRVVHRRRSRSRPAGDRAGVAPRRSAALHRARPIRVARRSPAGRTAWPGRGVASREAVAATARRRS